MRVAGLVPVGDDEGERRLRQLGVATMLGPGDDAAAVSARPHRAGRVHHVGAPTRRGSAGATGDADAWHGIRLDEPDRGRGADAPTPVTVVWGPTGAPGRTTLAVTLAARLAAAGVRTLLVDLDTWGASVAQVLGLVDEAPGAVAAARASEQGTLDVPGLARLAPEVVPGLRVLTGLPQCRPVARAAGGRRRGRAAAGRVASSTTSSSTSGSRSRTTRSSATTRPPPAATPPP